MVFSIRCSQLRLNIAQYIRKTPGKYCIIKTKEFGTILMMEVGAMMVGRITNHEAVPGYVTRGEEKGYFEFGGSTIILLTAKRCCSSKKEYFVPKRQRRGNVYKAGRKDRKS